MKSNNLEKFEAEMLKLGWELDTIYADEESRDGTSTLSMLYKFENWSIWSIFDISDRDLDNYQISATSGVFYDDYNDIVREILNAKKQYFRAKDVQWVFHGVVGSKVFCSNLSDLIFEWANSIDIALWLQHKADSEGTRFDERVYASAWYGYTEFIEKQILDLTQKNEDRYGVLTIDRLKKALELSRSRSRK